jgi:predicted RNA-binding protein
MKNYLLISIFFISFFATAQDVVSEKIYRTTEVSSKPDLKNGMYTLAMFISKNFKFPEIKNKKITVFTSFIIEPDGRMTDKKAFYVSAKDLIASDVVRIQTEDEKLAEAKAYDEMKTEAGRVLALFNETWIPGQVSGKPVRCLYNYPISFTIE